MERRHADDERTQYILKQLGELAQIDPAGYVELRDVLRQKLNDIVRVKTSHY